jgi:hypothetical protein
MNVVEVSRREVNVVTLPSKEVDCCHNSKNTNTSSGGPNDNGVSEKVIFDGYSQ